MLMFKHYISSYFCNNLRIEVISWEISFHTLPNTLRVLFFICLAKLYGILKQNLDGLKQMQVSAKLTKYYVKLR